MLHQVKDKLGANPVPIQIPIGQEDKFEGIIDLLEMKAHIWHGEELGAKFDITEIPESLKEQAKKYREMMIEKISDFSEEVMHNFLEGKESTIDQMKKAIRKGTLSNKMVPVLCGTSFKNKGVQPLLDAVCDYLPSPIDVLPIKGMNPDTQSEDHRPSDVKAPFAALAFKIQTDPFVGKLHISEFIPESLKKELIFTMLIKITEKGFQEFCGCTRTPERKLKVLRRET